MTADELPERLSANFIFSMHLLTVLLRYCPARPGVWSEYDEG